MLWIWKAQDELPHDFVLIKLRTSQKKPPGSCDCLQAPGVALFEQICAFLSTLARLRRLENNLGLSSIYSRQCANRIKPFSSQSLQVLGRTAPRSLQGTATSTAPVCNANCPSWQCCSCRLRNMPMVSPHSHADAVLHSQEKGPASVPPSLYILIFWSF